MARKYQHYSLSTHEETRRKTLWPIRNPRISRPLRLPSQAPRYLERNSSSVQRNSIVTFRFTPTQSINDPTPSNRPVYRFPDIRGRVNSRHSETAKQDLLSC